jgi:diguanylate cyclase (GGDEF)-like protein/PAS domain S-box-containing protein
VSLSSRRSRGLCLVTVLTALWLVGAVLGWGGDTQATWASDLLMPVLAAAAAVSLLDAARRRPAGARRPQLLLGLACVSWTVGETLWGVQELALGWNGDDPSAADVFYLGATPLAAVGLLGLLRGTGGVSRSARAALDGWLLAGSLLLLSWSFVVAPLLADSPALRLADGVALSYPVTDVVLATLALLAAREVAGAARQATLVIVAALLSMAVADSAYTALLTGGGYVSGGVADAGWVAGYSLLVLAGRLDTPSSDRSGHSLAPGRAAVLSPYVLVGVAAAAVMVQSFLNRSVPVVQSLLLSTLVVAVLVRQAVSVLENVGMSEELKDRERHLRSLLHGAQDLIVLFNPDLRATYVSPSCAHVLGCPPEALIGRPLWGLVHPEDITRVHDVLDAFLAAPSGPGNARLECRMLTPRGWIDTESSVGDLRDDPAVGGIVITTRDVSDRSELERQLRRQARLDPLTGLANRTVLSERLEHALLLRRAGSTPLGLLLVDLDGFKAVNDRAGHLAGDALLVEVGKRLTVAVRRGDTVARLGGDEFAVLLEDCDDGDLTAAGQVDAERILASLRRPIVIDGRELAVGASLGLVVARPDSTPEDMLREADCALYASKAAGRARVTVFGPDLHEKAMRDIELVADLPAAIADGQLELGYQPVVELRTGRVIGVEALARWNHPTRGYVGPVDFIPLAEQCGLIEDLGRWALTTALAQGERWLAAGRVLDVAVNVSARQLGPDFVALVESALAGSTMPPSRLTLELTESVLVDDARTHDALHALRALGVRLAVDDFGTGYSSLSYLRKLPIDILKLDRSFVAELGEAGADAVSKTVVKLALDLGLSVIAEGVETEEQRDLLAGMGCGLAQGWLFGRAVPARQVAVESARLVAAGPHRTAPPRPRISHDETAVSKI